MTRNWEHNAGLIWPKLVKCAKDNTVCHYEDLAKIVDTNSQSIRRALDPIKNFCRDENFPPLTIVVVAKGNNKPGGGYSEWGIDIDNILQGYELVYKFNWDVVSNPFQGYGKNDTSEAFSQTLLGGPDKAEDIYVQVKSRGQCQKIFRMALLEAYNFKCAFCQFGFEQALDAAHIIPWAECTPSQRMDPRNGILLCANHHRLFDKEYFSISSDYRIECRISDSRATLDLDGDRLHLPKDKELYPRISPP